MKKLMYIVFAFVFIFLTGCDSPMNYESSFYSCNNAWADSSALHPRADIYQEILDRNVKSGIVGASLAIIDEYGPWTGSSGSADLASGVEVMPCNRFLIASISKVFTASAVFRYIDRGLLTLDDPVNKWLDEELIKKIANADESTIRHLLSHTSGIPDYYSLVFEMDRLNKTYNKFSQEEILEYTFPLKPTHAVGETYYYCNTNFLLLGMILESVSGKSLGEVYNDELFKPLKLESARYVTQDAIPEGTIKGYADIYGDGKVVESKFLYQDELGTGDGGIGINAADLVSFFKYLVQGDVMSENSFIAMTDWFDLPDGWIDIGIGHFQNGLGLEHNKTAYGNSVGHTGGIDGFLSIAQYFPETAYAFVLLTNTATYDGEPRMNIFNESLDVMFE